MDALRLSFRGDRGGRALATWAQRECWEALQANGRHGGRLNLRFTLSLQRGTTADWIRFAVGSLIERHESLRTRFVKQQDAVLIQEIARTGQLTAEIVDIDGAASDEVSNIRDELAGRHFDTAIDWPIRFAVVMTRGRPRYLVGAVSHVAADAAAVGIICRDLQVLLHPVGPPLSAAPRQPQDEARHEATPRGRLIQTRSLAAWESGLQKVPPLPRVELPDVEVTPRYPAVELWAPGFGRRLQRLAESLRVGASAVAVAGGIVALAHVAGVDRFSLKLSCANRTRGYEDYVGMLAQQGIVPVETVRVPFSDLVRRCAFGIVQAHRSSRYDAAVLQQMARRKFEGIDPVIDHFVNFMYLDKTSKLRRPQPKPANGEYVCQPGAPVPFAFNRFGLVITTDGEDVYMRIFGDRFFIPQAAMRTVLEHAYHVMSEAGPA